MAGSSSRMLALLSLLQSTRDWPGAVLAERLGVSPRTVRRDVDRLRELGYRIGATKGPDGGYRLAAGSELPPLLFDDEQAVALAIALQNAPASGVDIDEAAARALATVRQVLPSRLRHRVDGIRFTAPRGSARVDPATLEAVSAAVRESRVLRIDYGDDDGERGPRPPRRIEPHALIARDERWYVVAWDEEAADWRIFRLDRMRPRSPAGRVFTPRAVPTGDARTYLSARFTGSSLADRWPCVGEVIVQLPLREVAPFVGDALAVPEGETATRLTVGSWSWAGVLAWVARFDADFRIVGPPALAAAAVSLGARVWRSAEAPERHGIHPA